MTPLYDVLSIWPYIRKNANQLYYGGVKQAMALRTKNVHYKISEINARHWHEIAYRYSDGFIWGAMIELAERVVPALERVQDVLPHNFPQYVWESIATNMRKQTEAFLVHAPRDAWRRHDGDRLPASRQKG